MVNMLGIELIASSLVPQFKTVLSTDRCRSPSRALRRYRQRGILGRIRIEQVPDRTVYMYGDNKAVMSEATLRAIVAEVDKLCPLRPDPVREAFYPLRPEPEHMDYVFRSPWLTSLSLTPTRTVKPIITS